MKKLMMIAAILALALVAAGTAIAQGIEQGVEPASGNAAVDHSVVNKGNYASQCTPALQTDNTGNFSNSPAILQYGGRSGGIEPEGVEVNFGGTVTGDCPSTIEQSSAASA